MLIWFVVSFVIPYYARELSAINLFGWPLPFYMAAQGTPLVYVVIIGAYAIRMRTLDLKYGLEQDAQG
jgi:putative solute:sodium symporter small subunit